MGATLAKKILLDGTGLKCVTQSFGMRWDFSTGSGVAFRNVCFQPILEFQIIICVQIGFFAIVPSIVKSKLVFSGLDAGRYLVNICAELLSGR